MAGNRGPRSCTACKTDLLVWHNANYPDSMIRVEMSADPDRGTVQKIVTGTGDTTKVWGKKLAGDELADAIASGIPLFMHHSKRTCPANRPTNPKPEGLELFLPNKKQPRR